MRVEISTLRLGAVLFAFGLRRLVQPDWHKPPPLEWDVDTADHTMPEWLRLGIEASPEGYLSLDEARLLKQAWDKASA